MKVLVVAAHPDDELLGVGGTVAAHAAAGDEVRSVILCEGISMRYESEREAVVRQQATEAAAILGVSDLVIGDLPDQRLDTIPVSEIAAIVEEQLSFGPQVIYTHFGGDLNRDHRIVAEATMVAARPYAAPTVCEILMFETPSSTEWATPAIATPFIPNRYVDVSRTLETKIAAFERYDAEVRTPPHPRSPQALRDRAAYWGSVCGVGTAEAFVSVRSIGLPASR